ncbi:MAG: DUF6364 family protein [Candidatus Hydrothermarchaeaceae archaeon]
MKVYIPEDPRLKLTLSIDGTIIQSAKEIAHRKGIPLSRLVENYLRFLSDPKVYCFSCGEKFSTKNSEVCPKCGWLTHDKCGGCRCAVNEETASALFYMRKVYEDLLGGRVE